MAKMHSDREDKKTGMKAKAILDGMLDPYLLMGMVALLPLLDAIDTLVCWAQKSDIFICDFIGALEKCKLQLFTAYRNEDTKCKRDLFDSLNQLV